MTYQDKKRALETQLRMIMAKDRQIQEKNKRLFNMRDVVASNDQADAKVLANIIHNINLQIDYNRQARKVLEHNVEWVKRELQAIEGKGFVQGGTLRFRPFAKIGEVD